MSYIYSINIYIYNYIYIYNICDIDNFIDPKGSQMIHPRSHCGRCWWSVAASSRTWPAVPPTWRQTSTRRTVPTRRLGTWWPVFQREERWGAHGPRFRGGFGGVNAVIFFGFYGGIIDLKVGIWWNMSKIPLEYIWFDNCTFLFTRRDDLNYLTHSYPYFRGWLKQSIRCRSFGFALVGMHRALMVAHPSFP